MASEINNYIEDDWDDNKLSSRDSPAKGYYYNYHTGGTGDLLKGVYRPKWDIDGGTATASSGNLILDGGDTVRTPSDFTVGEWTFDYRMTVDDPNLYFNATALSTTRRSSTTNLESGYVPFIRSGGGNEFTLWKDDGGSVTDVISNTWSTDTNTHTHKTTRDSYGNFELFLDSTSKGTGNDAQFNSSNYVAYGSSKNSVEVDNLIIQ